MGKTNKYETCLSKKGHGSFLFLTLAILAITNPTKNDLKDWLRAKGYEESGGRIGYFGIFSTFKVYIGDEYIEPNRIYLGILKNFILVKKIRNASLFQLIWLPKLISINNNALRKYSIYHN